MTPDMSVWRGRTDEHDGPLALRWHQKVQPLTPGCHSGIALIGFACDEGVRRNGGRIGAKDGPRAIRAALANLAWHQQLPVYDAGNMACDDGDMEGAQSRLAEVVAAAIRAGHRPLVLGGGHETAWGTFQGLVAAKPQAAVGDINIDAHLDFRADPVPNSGTPFRQIANSCASANRHFRYLALGIAEPSNTVALFECAARCNGLWFYDRDLATGIPEPVRETIADLIAECGRIHLSIDLDVLPAAAMPAVSAPSALGVPLHVVEKLAEVILESGKVDAVDLVELSPRYDIADRGAKVAARLAWLIAAVWR